MSPTDHPVLPDRYELAPGLTISRAVTGLWQVADIERKSGALDPTKGADDLARYVDAGFDTFDMADHYGTSEIVTGNLLQRFLGQEERPRAFTKWCPPPGPMTTEIVRVGVEERLIRLGVSCIDLLQFHWWSFENPSWLDALHEMAVLREEGLIREIGVTNFDAAHLHLAMADGIPLRTNQVSFSLVDRRAAGQLAELCSGSQARLLAYGTLCGGFLSERWLGAEEPVEIADWSKMKYKRFIDAAGGWEVFQGLLRAVQAVAVKHGVSLPNVATRWVLEQTGVAGVVIGARLGENMHATDNARLFSFGLDEEDHARLEDAFATTTPIPGDCGDEYRKPPFLTASGDLSHHLDEMPLVHGKTTVPHRPGAHRVLSGSKWEDIAGYCRAQRIGDRILVSGTTATAGSDRVVAPDDAGAQTTFILDKILAALSALDAGAEDVVRTRIYLTNETDVLAVSRAHGRIFGDIKPANTLVVVKELIGDYCVEIEAEAVL
ncbi:aldo/keto reductase [Aliiruegeria lutimaris]|uniref:Predicted oxidoreductase n=1 Tax=Aliiruegeria lutimaris TaxID=571298 RepID=A0A1G9HD97_9RHOB|nr:aldo/keto reductase [Aliiruegeria lutimaris]SDL10940.1 Predicted oxidoreductase [Aliiruegeria lutimaris]